VTHAELQAAFARYLVAGDNEAELAAEVVSDGVNAAARLEVYRNAFYMRLQDALAHDFPALLATPVRRPSAGSPRATCATGPRHGPRCAGSAKGCGMAARARRAGRWRTWPSWSGPRCALSMPRTRRR